MHMCLSPRQLEMEINAKICFSGKSSFLIRKQKAQDSFVLLFLVLVVDFLFLLPGFCQKETCSFPTHSTPPTPKLKYLSKIILLSAQSQRRERKNNCDLKYICTSLFFFFKLANWDFQTQFVFLRHWSQVYIQFLMQDLIRLSAYLNTFCYICIKDNIAYICISFT